MATEPTERHGKHVWHKPGIIPPRSGFRVFAISLFPCHSVGSVAKKGLSKCHCDQHIRSRGYGEAMVQFAMSIAKQAVMPRIGCRFLIAEAKSGVLLFCEKIGFAVVDTEKNKGRKLPVVFLDLHKPSN